jgi:hypothetical protein
MIAAGRGHSAIRSIIALAVESCAPPATVRIRQCAALLQTSPWSRTPSRFMVFWNNIVDELHSQLDRGLIVPFLKGKSLGRPHFSRACVKLSLSLLRPQCQRVCRSRMNPTARSSERPLIILAMITTDANCCLVLDRGTASHHPVASVEVGGEGGQKRFWLEKKESQSGPSDW